MRIGYSWPSGHGRRTCGALAASAAIAAIAAISACGSPAARTTTLQGPTSVQAVASELHLTGLTDCGPAPLGGVTDSGTAYEGSERIGIDTFPGPQQRDAWKRTSADFGVVPFAQGPDWVAYKAADQQAKGCG